MRITPILWTLAAAAAMLSAPELGEARPRPPHHRHRRVAKTVVVTGYCLGPCRRCQTRGRTKTGTRCCHGAAVSRHGTIVAPLGSKVYVPGYGWAKVDDVGGKVRRNQIDLRFRSHRMAAGWGRRTMRVVAVLPS